MAATVASPEKRAPKPRSLAPKEHGAYAQLALPLVTALAGGSPRASSLLLVVTTSAVFAAHEPVLVLLGRRGARARTTDGPRAARMLRVLLALAIATGAAGLVLGGAEVALACVAPAVLGAAVAWLVREDAEKTAGGELLAAAALSSTALPVAIAAGWSSPTAFAAWAAWVLAFAAATSGVRSVIAHRKQGSGTLARLASVGVAPVIAVALVAAGVLPRWSAITAAPVFVASLVLACVPPHPRALQRIGWMIVVASIESLVGIVVVERGVL